MTRLISRLDGCGPDHSADRQLQYVSDTVAPYEGPNNEIMRENLLNEEATLRKKVDAAEAKHRYRMYPYHR